MDNFRRRAEGEKPVTLVRIIKEAEIDPQSLSLITPEGLVDTTTVTLQNTRGDGGFYSATIPIALTFLYRNTYKREYSDGSVETIERTEWQLRVIDTDLLPNSTTNDIKITYCNNGSSGTTSFSNKGVLSVSEYFISDEFYPGYVQKEVLDDDVAADKVLCTNLDTNNSPILAQLTYGVPIKYFTTLTLYEPVTGSRSFRQISKTNDTGITIKLGGLVPNLTLTVKVSPGIFA